jgi:hypothetical protein
MLYLHVKTNLVPTVFGRQQDNFNCTVIINTVNCNCICYSGKTNRMEHLFDEELAIILSTMDKSCMKYLVNETLPKKCCFEENIFKYLKV